jgi:hypothetical protein
MPRMIRCAATTNGLFIPSTLKDVFITQLSSIGRAIHPNPSPTVLAAAAGPAISAQELLIALQRSGIKNCLYSAYGQKYPFVPYIAMLFRICVPKTPIHLDLAINQQFDPQVAPMVAILRNVGGAAGHRPMPTKSSTETSSGQPVPLSEPESASGLGMGGPSAEDYSDSDSDSGSSTEHPSPRGVRHSDIKIDRVAQIKGYYGFVSTYSPDFTPDFKLGWLRVMGDSRRSLFNP